MAKPNKDSKIIDELKTVIKSKKDQYEALKKLVNNLEQVHKKTNNKTNKNPKS